MYALSAADLIAFETSELAALVERYSDDRAALRRRWAVPYSESRRERFRRFYAEWQASLDALSYDALGTEARLDYQMLRNELWYRGAELDREELLRAQMEELLPFASSIEALEERRRDRQPVQSEEAAELLAGLPDRIDEVRDRLRERDEGDGEDAPSRVVALRAAETLGRLTSILNGWYEHYAGYDPVFTWWNESPHEAAKEALEGYEKSLREEIVGAKDGEEPIVGDPIGADALAADLRHAMIVYTPAELIAIGERELAWGEARMLEASREMGFGDDWKAALEHVKTLHREPGEQTQLTRELAEEAVAFLK
ncbi:MAG: DUF885 family protein, partial [Gemmatimonadota bacterium]